MKSFVRRVITGLYRRLVYFNNNRKIARFAREINNNSAKDSTNTVVIFNASTRLIGMSQNAAFSLLTGWALKLQGARVVQFVCNSGLKKCVLGTDITNVNNSPSCRICIKQSQAFSAGIETRWFKFTPDDDINSKISNLNLEQLKSFEYEGFHLGQLVLPSLRWILRRHHINDYADIHSLYKEYIVSAWNVKREFEKLIHELQPKAVLIFNGMFYPEAMVKKVAQNMGIPAYTHEVSLQPLSAFFTDGEATAYPIYIPQEFQLNDKQNDRLDEYLNQRFEGNFTMAGIQFWPEMQNLDREIVQKIDSFKHIVPVFTNVVFDTSQKHANIVFEHMFEWLDVTLELIKSNPDTLFIIRAHPDELRTGKSSHENVAGWVKKNDVEKLENVIFINAKEFVSSYELIRRSKFVMVYNSTIGLEASIMGAPVLCGGKARFTQLPTVFYPRDKSDFLDLAEHMLSVETINIPAEYRINARRFLYYQLFISSLPFDGFVKNDGVSNGYVTLKHIKWQDLLPENSQTTKTLVKGILEGKGFLLDHEA